MQGQVPQESMNESEQTNEKGVQSLDGARNANRITASKRGTMHEN
jgi:hypothetical protein